MVRYIEFPAASTAEITKRLNAAGDGAVLRIVVRGAKDGTGMAFDARVRSAATLAAKDEDCEPDVNDSHLCPPIC